MELLITVTDADGLLKVAAMTYPPTISRLGTSEYISGTEIGHEI